MIPRPHRRFLRLRATASLGFFVVSLIFGCLTVWTSAAGDERSVESLTVASEQPRIMTNESSCGSLCFTEPYSSDGSIPPTPTSGKRGLSTQLNKVDVGFVMDTTGSMGGSISALKASLSTTIIPALQGIVPSLGIGVAGHDDVPINPY